MSVILPNRNILCRRLCTIVTIYPECTVRIVKQTRPGALSWEGGECHGQLVLLLTLLVRHMTN